MVEAPPAPPAPKAGGGKKKPADEPVELSEEDQALKDKLDLCVTRITEPGADRALLPAALAAVSDEVRAATTSMSAVPKPLKFLRGHYPALVDAHARMAAAGPSAAKDAAALADVLSVLAISAAPRGARDSLKYRLAGEQVRGERGGGETHDDDAWCACVGRPRWGARRGTGLGRGARIAIPDARGSRCLPLTPSLPPLPLSPPSLSSGPRRRVGPRVRAQPGGRAGRRVGCAPRGGGGVHRRPAGPGGGHRAVPHAAQRG